MSSDSRSENPEVEKVLDVQKSDGPSESGNAAGVLISLAAASSNTAASTSVTEPPSPPPQLPIHVLPPVLRNIVNNEPIVHPDSHTMSSDVTGVSSRITKDFFQMPHPHALSKELVFEILTSGACAPEAPVHNSASPIDRRINFFYVTSAKSPGNLGVEDAENEISVSFQSIANSGPWWSQYSHDGKRFGIVTRHMSRRSRVQGRTGLHLMNGQSGRAGDQRPQDELHGFQGRWFCLVSAPSHLIGDKPAKMKMAKAIPGALSLVQIWDASSNDSISSRRGKRKRIEGGLRPGFMPGQPGPYGWPSMSVDAGYGARQYDPRQETVEQAGNSWRSRIQTYSKALTDDDVFSDREEGDDGESDEEHGAAFSGQVRATQGNGVGRPVPPPREWNPFSSHQSYDQSGRPMAGPGSAPPGMQPPPQHRWMNPFQREQMSAPYPPYSNQAYDQRFMNGPNNGHTDMVIGLQYQVQSLMRAVAQLQNQLASQSQSQSSHQGMHMLPRTQEDHVGIPRSNSRNNSSDRKSPERWPNSSSQHDLGLGVSGTNGNAGSFDMFTNAAIYGTSYPMTSSIDLGSHSFDTTLPSASSNNNSSTANNNSSSSSNIPKNSQAENS